MEFKYLLILLETWDCLLFILKLLFPVDAEKSSSTSFGTRKKPSVQSPKPILETQKLKWVYAICSSSLWQL